jgi:hypothetical protein
MATRYANIVFMQDDDADYVLDRLCRVHDWVIADGPTQETIEAAIDYLAQWDYGTESEHDLRDEIGAGTSDDIFEHGDYVLTWHLGLGYVGLMRKVKV